MRRTTDQHGIIIRRYSVPIISPKQPQQGRRQARTALAGHITDLAGQGRKRLSAAILQHSTCIISPVQHGKAVVMDMLSTQNILVFRCA